MTIKVNKDALRTEIPDSMILTKKTFTALLFIERFGCVYFEPDDGPDDALALEQLKEICTNVGYDISRPLENVGYGNYQVLKDKHYIFTNSDAFHQL